MKLKKENQLNAVSACVRRLVLRWVFVGWWAVPCLAVLALLCVILDAGGWWDGEKWNHDPDLIQGFDWAAEKIGSFFK